MRLSHATQSIIGDTLSVWIRGVEDITIQLSVLSFIVQMRETYDGGLHENTRNKREVAATITVAKETP